MDFSTRLRQRQLSFSSVDIHIILNLFFCLLIASFFNVNFDLDDSRLFLFASSLHWLQLIVYQTKVISQKYSIFESNNFITRIVFIGLVISLMLFPVVFPLSLIIGLFVFVDNYTRSSILYFPIMLMIITLINLAIITINDRDSRLFHLVNYLSRFAVRKIPKILSFINSTLGAKYFPVRSLFVLLINASTLVNVIGSLFVLLILSVILHDPNNLTAANIILYLLAFSVIFSGIRIFIEIKLSLKANKLYLQGNKLFKQETETSKIQAIGIFEQALLLYKKTNYQIWAAITLDNIGLVYNALEEKQTALDYFNQSLDLFKKIHDRGSIANTLYNLAVLRYNQGNLYEALTKIESAIKIIEELYTEIIITNLPQSDLTTIQKYYQFYIDLLIKLHKQNPNQGYDIKAYEVREKLKNRQTNLTIIHP